MNNIKQLSEREHIIKRPAMYIGSTDIQDFQEFLLEEKDKTQTMTRTEVKYVPGLIKIINEIIDNSVDVAIKTNFKFANQISINITSDSVQVTDNGSGIPVTKSEDGIYLPELCWGYARAGSNFDDDENRTHLGMNGVGSFATNCFSKKFIGDTSDGKNNFKITFKNNCSESSFELSKTKDKGTTVKFWPDFTKFGVDSIDDVHINIIKQRLINLSICHPSIEFKFNNKKLGFNSFKKYASLFGPGEIISDTDTLKVAILHNPSDDFIQVSYVNGLKIPDGGTHIDYIFNSIGAPLRDKLQKKFKGIKPGDIKNKLQIICFMTDVKNCKFNSQSKEKITNTQAEISKYFSGIDFEEVTKKILKNKDIIDPITEIYRIKEEFKKRQEMKNLEKPKSRINCEGYLAPIKDKKYLMIVEGNSARGGLSSAFGRKDCGYYTLRGKPLNAYSQSHQKFTANKELVDLYQILKNEIDYEELKDGDWFKITIDNKEYLVNENDNFFIDGKLTNVKEIMK